MDWMNHLMIFYSLSVLSQVLARDTIFVTDIEAGKIRRASLESLDFEDIPLKTIKTPIAVDYDPVDHKLYWTDKDMGSWAAIMRANLDGTQEEYVVSYLSEPEGLSIDVINRHLYWTDRETKTIERANLDGTDKVVITQENHDEPRAIVVDPQGGLMYWTDWGNNSKIERANLDGSERVVLVDTGLHLPNGLAVDFEGKRMYWCDAGLNRIDSTDLDGQNRVNLGTFVPETIGIDIHPFDIGVYNNDLYWSDWSVPRLLRMNKFIGLIAQGVGSAVFEKPGGLHIFKDEVNECSSNPCNAGECVDEINFYLCNCIGTGFEGDRCEINIDDCAAAPCLNAGICKDSVNAFSCQCATGFYGELCQHNSDNHDNDVCTPVSCANGGQCIDLINEYRCECLPGYTGSRCEEDIDECSSSPCANSGTCMDLDNKFECRCTPGYEGPTCNILTTPKTVISSESSICIYPGDIANGHVIQENPGDTLVPGTSLKFVCQEEYDLIGTKEVYCRTDGTWSDASPTCVTDDEDESFVSSSVVYGGGAGGVLLIIILLIILIVVCCMKRNKNELPNPVVHYTANGAQAPKGPKETAKYSTSVTETMHYHQEPTMGAGFDRPAMPMPRPIPTNHVYDSVNFGAEGADGGVGRFPPDLPPSYISSIGDRKGTEEGEFNNGYMTLTKDAELESEYLYMKRNEVRTPVYDVPRPARDYE